MMKHTIILILCLIGGTDLFSQTSIYAEAGFLRSQYDGNNQDRSNIYKYDPANGFHLGAGASLMSEKKFSVNIGLDYSLRGATYFASATTGTIDPLTGSFVVEEYSSKHSFHALGISTMAQYNIRIKEKHAILLGIGISPSLMLSEKYTPTTAQNLDDIIIQYQNTTFIDIPLKIGYRFQNKYEVNVQGYTPISVFNTYDQSTNFYTCFNFAYLF